MNEERRATGLAFTLKIWRQSGPEDAGQFEEYPITRIRPEMSLLEVLDILNEELTSTGREPIAFDSDCREGICGSCGLFVNGEAHGPTTGTTTYQVYMRSFEDGSDIYIEPWRATAFPVIKDLVVDRSAFDRIICSGGYVSVNAGSPPDANAILISKDVAEEAMDAAACIGCGACVASCKNASAMLFVSAKVKHLGVLPQGQPERKQRAKVMLNTMDAEGFGNCTNEYACEASCPKEISVEHIAFLNREFVRGVFRK